MNLNPNDRTARCRRCSKHARGWLKLYPNDRLVIESGRVMALLDREDDPQHTERGELKLSLNEMWVVLGGMESGANAWLKW